MSVLGWEMGIKGDDEEGERDKGKDSEKGIESTEINSNAEYLYKWKFYLFVLLTMQILLLDDETEKVRAKLNSQTFASAFSEIQGKGNFKGRYRVSRSNL